MYIDTHCHLDDEVFNGNIEQIVKNYLSCGVSYAINNACNVKSSFIGKELSDKFESVFFTVGIHPQYVDDISTNNIELFYNLVNDKKCLAVGEIGLDYHYSGFDRNKQIEGFNLQIEFADKVNLPFSIHSRDATLDTLNSVKNNRNKLNNGFVVHCFSGSRETAKEYLDLGGYLSFGGTSTFKNSVNVRDVISYCPSNRILTETDSPYLSPEPFRGKTNEPKNIPIICDFIAEIKGIGKEDFKESVLINAKKLFKKINV